MSDLIDDYRRLKKPEAAADDTYTVGTAQYAKGMLIVRCPSSDGFKTRAARLIGDGLHARWTHRESGYIASPAKVKKFEQLFVDGCDASTVTGKIYKPALEDV
jgi:hypothetical protein